MGEFDFEELRKGIYYKLIYPDDILATRLEAMRILGFSNYFFKKARTFWDFNVLVASGYTFYYKEDLYAFKREMKEPYQEIKNLNQINYENLIERIRLKLVYPEDQLLTRKTGPTFLSMNKKTFDLLRFNREFAVYEHLGVKFFNKEELRIWKDQRRPYLKI